MLVPRRLLKDHSPASSASELSVIFLTIVKGKVAFQPPASRERLITVVVAEGSPPAFHMGRSQILQLVAGFRGVVVVWSTTFSPPLLIICRDEGGCCVLIALSSRRFAAVDALLCVFVHGSLANHPHFVAAATSWYLRLSYYVSARCQGLH